MELTPTANNALVNMEMHLEPVYLGEPTNNIEPPIKRRKKKSMVWEHFTIETVGLGCRRACCKQCKQSFAYSTGSKVAGTSHLKRHIAKGSCPVVLRNQQHDPSSPFTPIQKVTPDSTLPTTDTPKRRYRTTTSFPYVGYDADTCRQEIARMIILHDYPLHIIEHPGFVTFLRNIQPRFEMLNFSTVQGDCIATYLREKQRIQHLIEGMPGRICLTLDLWNSCQTTGYVFVTGQFVDSEWKIHRKLLNVVMEPYPESDSAFSHAVSSCLSDWNIEGRLFSLTINQSLSEVGIDSLKSLLSENPNILGGQLLLNHCLARSLATIAMESINSGQETVNKVRNCVKYVKTNEILEEKFLELRQQLQVPSTKSLQLDDQNRWNTTYEMLQSAFELKEVFSCLDTSEADYGKAPTAEEWNHVENLCTYLKLLFDTANLLTSSTIPTTNTFFHEAWKIQLELARGATSDDVSVRGIAIPMRENFDKYWKSCCLILAIAVVMDPRFKMKLVEFSFTKIYGEEAVSYINLVDEGIHQLFLDYVALPVAGGGGGLAEGGGGGGGGGGLDAGGVGLTDFDMYIMETTSQQSKSELDQYLEESLLPRVHEFDVVGWWKLNKVKYPTLSKMARDILTIPVSTVIPESVFEVGRKEMDRYRCSLRAETVEAIVCAKDWLRDAGEGDSGELMKAFGEDGIPNLI